MKEFTVAPLFSEDSGNPIGHEWAVDRKKSHAKWMVEFARILDKHLMDLIDYSAKRSNDLVLQLPKVNFMPVGTLKGG